MASQLLRLNDRVRNIVLCEEEARELPSEMDFDKGYNHLTMKSAYTSKVFLAVASEESRGCTAFMTKTHGLLRWKALPMGFKNSSAYFQRAIELLVAYVSPAALCTLTM